MLACQKYGMFKSKYKKKQQNIFTLLYKNKIK